MKYNKKSYRRRGRKGGKRKATVSKVRSIVKKELAKTQETIKLVSFMKNRPIRSINVDNPYTQTIVYSLTGGRMGQGEVLGQGAETPTDSSLFSLRPADKDSTSLGGDGGQVDSSESTVQDSRSTQGVHVLRGRTCFLKNWYCNIRINNQGNQPFTTVGGDVVSAEDPQNPLSQGVRLLIVETRRPLGQDRLPGTTKSNLARQLFLQFHSGADTGVQVAPAVPVTADAITGFLNLQVIKKVHYDKLFWMGSGDTGNVNTQRILRLKVRVNKKAYWNYQYNTDDPTVSPILNYQGPFIYMIALASSDQSQSLDIAPRMDISSILTLEDD